MRVGVSRTDGRNGDERVSAKARERERWPSVTNNRPKAEILAPRCLAMNYITVADPELK